MRRTQLYLDDELWTVLHRRARKEKTTVSDLMRTAVRERYITRDLERRKILEGMIGLWKNREDLPDTETFIRSLRDDDRLERLYGSDRSD